MFKYPLWMRLPLLGLRLTGRPGVLGISARRERVACRRLAEGEGGGVKPIEILQRDELDAEG